MRVLEAPRCKRHTELRKGPATGEGQGEGEPWNERRSVAIQVLPPGVAARIAAGEVIERPASVVKELVENALDAGARAVGVEIRHGGLASIRVTDDGCGIPADEVALAFERHATSKLASVEDLAGIGTLGFRGEALASIAAAAGVRMTTRTADAESAVAVELEGGEIVRQSAAGAGAGTTIEVEALFSTIPARLKFIRSPAAETARVRQTVDHLAMAHPHVRFTLRDGRQGAARHVRQRQPARRGRRRPRRGAGAGDDRGRLVDRRVPRVGARGNAGAEPREPHRRQPVRQQPLGAAPRRGRRRRGGVPGPAHGGPLPHCGGVPRRAARRGGRERAPEQARGAAVARGRRVLQRAARGARGAAGGVAHRRRRRVAVAGRARSAAARAVVRDDVRAPGA